MNLREEFVKQQVHASLRRQIRIDNPNKPTAVSLTGWVIQKNCPPTVGTLNEEWAELWNSAPISPIEKKLWNSCQSSCILPPVGLASKVAWKQLVLQYITIGLFRECPDFVPRKINVVYAIDDTVIIYTTFIGHSPYTQQFSGWDRDCGSIRSEIKLAVRKHA